MKIGLLFVFAFIFISCKDDKSGKGKFDDSDESMSVVDTVDTSEDMYELKEKIIMVYNQIPTSIFEVNDGIDYSNLDEAIKLDSLFGEYSRHKLSDKEKQLFGIAKFKAQLKLLHYENAINELKSIPVHPEFENYKDVLFGIAYNFKGDTVLKKRYFNKLLKKFEDSVANGAEDCGKYFILKVLSGSDELKICENRLQEFKELKSMGGKEIVRNYFLTDLEL